MPIRALEPGDAAGYLAHRLEALRREPLSFLSSPEDDAASTAESIGARLRGAPDAVVFGAFADDRLVGSVGIYREPKAKASHRAHVWGLYVDPGHRGRGLGFALMTSAVQHARSLPGVLQVELGVTDGDPGARRLYERLGFRVWGTLPRYLAHGGRQVACHHLVLVLDEV